MKISQKAKFQSVIITLETPEEVTALWDGIQFTLANLKNKESNKAKLIITLSDWFSQRIKL